MAQNEEVILQLNEVRAHFRVKEGLLKAVDGIGLAIRRRRTLGIVGESGCGKSVTSQAILRLLPAFATVSGEMLLRRTRNGRDEIVDIAKLDPNGEDMRSIRGGEIAIIFQEPMKAFSPIHTIGDQIIEAIVLHQTQDRKEAKRIALETLRKVGMSNPEQRLNEYPHQLSGGMRQRAMIAMAVAGNPAVLIADEPTTALDVTVQAQVLRLINELKEDSGTSVVFITHDLGVIAEMSDEVAVMYLGKVVEYADVDTLFYEAAHPYTQALLASIPSLAGRQERLETIEGTVPFPIDLPEGCGFYNRCPKARPGVCNRGEVPLYEVKPGHQVRCVLVEPQREAN
ncbi:ABC transporter ATP-binding protein [Paenibacillus hodogayensis]|uniref:ABC transporter ATP-binding protein n=1 Tax=Paenibacillus hodogayensis TaxID=279208 RepID=A0ABV5W910_9BACL